MSQGELRFAGWMAVGLSVGAMLSIVRVYLETDALVPSAVLWLLKIGASGAVIYLLWVFNRFLKARFYFRKATIPTLFLIGLVILQYPVRQFVLYLFNELIISGTQFVVWSGLLFLIFSVLALVLAAMVSWLKRDHFGVVKWYRRTLIGLGIGSVLYTVPFISFILSGASERLYDGDLGMALLRMWYESTSIGLVMLVLKGFFPFVVLLSGVTGVTLGVKLLKATRDPDQFCRSCGIILSEKDGFCSNCGARRGTASRLCSQCGGELLLGMRFCAGCGAKVADVASP